MNFHQNETDDVERQLLASERIEAQVTKERENWREMHVKATNKENY